MWHGGAWKFSSQNPQGGCLEIWIPHAAGNVAGTVAETVAGDVAREGTWKFGSHMRRATASNVAGTVAGDVAGTVALQLSSPQGGGTPKDRIPAGNIGDSAGNPLVVLPAF